jgi:alpha-beta hydrolase superfamily lysophospholipase
VATYDLRGQGRSGGRRGHVERFAEFTDDLFAVVEQLRRDTAGFRLGRPIAFGHSLGALITTVAALEQPRAFRAIALSSPFFGLALRPPRWKVALGKRLTNVWPTYREKSGIPLEQLTHDAKRVEMMRADPLRVEHVTARWYTETELARARVLRYFGTLPLPVFCLAADQDYVADVNVTQGVFAASHNPAHVLDVMQGTYHELHQEIGRDEYLARFQSQFETWCAAR